jgi:hypothetical protein
MSVRTVPKATETIAVIATATMMFFSAGASSSQDTPY